MYCSATHIIFPAAYELHTDTYYTVGCIKIDSVEWTIIWVPTNFGLPYDQRQAVCSAGMIVHWIFENGQLIAIFCWLLWPTEKISVCTSSLPNSWNKYFFVTNLMNFFLSIVRFSLGRHSFSAFMKSFLCEFNESNSPKFVGL